MEEVAAWVDPALVVNNITVRQWRTGEKLIDDDVCSANFAIPVPRYAVTSLIVRTVFVPQNAVVCGFSVVQVCDEPHVPAVAVRR